MTTTVLDREMYTEARAARLLGVPPATLHYWLEGGQRDGRVYKPVIRVEPKGTRNVTWAEFVEAGLLSQYRRRHKVPMHELRGFIDGLRRRLGVPYPLAHETPWVANGRRLVSQVQVEVGLRSELALVAEVSGQFILSAPADDFFDRVTWDEDVAAKWRPADSPKSPVVIDPEVRFGDPQIAGVSTAVLWELYEGGEDEQDLAGIYDLSLNQVRWALAYEGPQASAG